MSLDTKYRPRTYEDVLGQKDTIKTLKGFISKRSRVEAILPVRIFLRFR